MRHAANPCARLLHPPCSLFMGIVIGGAVAPM